MYVASWSNTMRGAHRIVHAKLRQSSLGMPIYGVRREWFPEPVPQASPEELIARVAAWHGLTAGDITGRSRLAAIALARRDAMAAVRYAWPGLSLPALGRHFRRDHKTVMYGLRMVGAATVVRKCGGAAHG